MSSASASRWRWSVAAVAALSVAGCAEWDRQPEHANQLPPARMAPDAVVLELAFVRLPVADRASYDAIWSQVDEQHFAPELRMELAANGLRAGVLGQQLPTELRAVLDAAAGQLEERAEDIETNDTQTNLKHRRIQCRTGKRAKIVVSRTRPSMSFLTLDEGRVHGSVLEDAQCLLALKPYAQGDGRVRLDITPEVEHGELRSGYASAGQGSLMMRQGRERVILERLRTVATLSAGQVLVVSNTPDIKGVGEHFFSETAGGRAERTLVLLRVAQTQWNDLFVPEQFAPPLATPAE
jgi:hypothetical protein